MLSEPLVIQEKKIYSDFVEIPLNDTKNEETERPTTEEEKSAAKDQAAKDQSMKEQSMKDQSMKEQTVERPTRKKKNKFIMPERKDNIKPEKIIISGVTGFVELYNDHAEKYICINNMYWLREYAILSYLWFFSHSNISSIRETSIHYKDNPKTKKRKIYYQISMEKYSHTLEKCVISTDDQLIQVMIDIVSAIKFCHDVNIIHRDLKSGNIMIDKNNRAVIIDFSHAIKIFPLKNPIKMDMCVSTISHRAPEVFLYEDNLVPSYDEKIDVWSVGVIFLELVMKNKQLYDILFTKEANYMKKFFLEQTEEKYMAKLQELYDTNKNSNLLFHDQYFTWIKKMLRYSSKERISMTELLNELLMFCHKERIQFIHPTFNINFEYTIGHHIRQHLEEQTRKLSAGPTYNPKKNMLDYFHINLEVSEIMDEIINNIEKEQNTVKLNTLFNNIDNIAKIKYFHTDSKVIFDFIIEYDKVNQKNDNHTMEFISAIFLVLEIVLHDNLLSMSEMIDIVSGYTKVKLSRSILLDSIILFIDSKDFIYITMQHNFKKNNYNFI